MKTFAQPLKPKFQNRAASAALAVKIVYSFGGEQKDTRFVILPVGEIKHYASGKNDEDNTTYLKSSLDHYVTVRLPLDEFWEKMKRPDQNGLVDLTAFTGPENFLAMYHQTPTADIAAKDAAQDTVQDTIQDTAQNGGAQAASRQNAASSRRVK